MLTLRPSYILTWHVFVRLYARVCVVCVVCVSVVCVSAVCVCVQARVCLSVFGGSEMPLNRPTPQALGHGIQ